MKEVFLSLSPFACLSKCRHTHSKGGHHNSVAALCAGATGNQLIVLFVSPALDHLLDHPQQQKSSQRHNPGGVTALHKGTGSYMDQVEVLPLATNLVVKNLPRDLSDRELFQAFSTYGKVLSANIMRNLETGASHGFGFVLFEDEASAQKALDNLPNIALGNPPAKIKAQRAHHSGTNVAINTPKIVIHNIPKHISELRVLKEFAEFGTITDCTMRPNTHIAFIQYSNAEEARRAAQEMHNTTPFGCEYRPLFVKLAETPELRARRRAFNGIGWRCADTRAAPAYHPFSQPPSMGPNPFSDAIDGAPHHSSNIMLEAYGGKNLSNSSTPAPMAPLCSGLLHPITTPTATHKVPTALQNGDRTNTLLMQPLQHTSSSPQQFQYAMPCGKANSEVQWQMVNSTAMHHAVPHAQQQHLPMSSAVQYVTIVPGASAPQRYYVTGVVPQQHRNVPQHIPALPIPPALQLVPVEFSNLPYAAFAPQQQSARCPITYVVANGSSGEPNVRK